MPFATRSIDPGTTPSVPVAVDQVGGADYQRTKLANPNADQTGAYGTDADPMRVRNRELGTNDYDSGLQNLPNADTQLTAATVYVKTVFLHNLTAQVQRVNVRNTAGVYLLKDYDMAPHEIVNLPRHGAELVGIHWQAANVNAVAGQVNGWQ